MTKIGDLLFSSSTETMIKLHSRMHWPSSGSLPWGSRGPYNPPPRFLKKMMIAKSSPMDFLLDAHSPPKLSVWIHCFYLTTYAILHYHFSTVKKLRTVSTSFMDGGFEIIFVCRKKNK